MEAFGIKLTNLNNQGATAPKQTKNLSLGGKLQPAPRAAELRVADFMAQQNMNQPSSLHPARDYFAQGLDDEDR